MLADTSDFEIISPYLSPSRTVSTQQPAPVPSAFGWIDPDHFLRDFQRLEPRDPYSQLWDKFWGNGQQLDPPTLDGDAVLNDGQDSDVVGTAKKDDRIPGCRIIDISIPNFIQKLFIRVDYIRIYECLEKRRIELTGVSGPRRHAVGILTGHPGVGKTVWMLYALVRRLSEQKPTILHRGKENYLFVAEGVYEFSDMKYIRYFAGDVWALVDSDVAPNGLPRFFVRRDASLFVVFESFPSEERWAWVQGIASPIVVTMNPWTRWEIHQAALAQGSIDLRRVDNAFYHFGPLPRLCIDLPLRQRDIVRYEAQLERTISLTSSWGPPSCYDESGALHVGKLTPLNMVITSRLEWEDVESDATLSIITRHVARRLAMKFLDHLNSSSRNLDAQTYKYFTLDANPVSLDALLLDIRANKGIKSKAAGCLMSMQPDRALEAGMRVFRSDGCYSTLYPPSLSGTDRYSTNGELDRLTLNVLYIPLEDGSLQMFHSFCVKDDVLHIFRVTREARETVGPELVRYFEGREGIPAIDKWRFVFLIPDGYQLACLVPPQDDKLARLSLYTCQFYLPA